VSEDADRFAFSVRAASKQKGIAWVWLEKEMLLASDEEKFFTEPHLQRFPRHLGPARGDRRRRACRADHRRVALPAPKVLVKELERREQP
jgi:hypothetical protein